MATNCLFSMAFNATLLLLLIQQSKHCESTVKRLFQPKGEVNSQTCCVIMNFQIKASRSVFKVNGGFLLKKVIFPLVQWLYQIYHKIASKITCKKAL